MFKQQHYGEQCIFTKPVSDTKAFTGTVLSSAADFPLLGTVSGRTTFWVSPAIHFESEYRVFVLHGKVVGVQQYVSSSMHKCDGNDVGATTREGVALDMDVVHQAVATLEDSDDAERTAAYALDFGLVVDPSVSSGKGTLTTVLVEWNDGYALGSYGLDPVLYTEILVARWKYAVRERKE